MEKCQGMVTIASLAANGGNGYGLRLCDWLARRCPDIVTIQKTGSNLPAEDLRKMGYESEVLASSRAHLGVAVLSRDAEHKPDVQARDLPGAEGESRFLTVDINGLWVSSVYASFGPRRLGRARAIEYRIAWLNRLQDHLDNLGYAHRNSVLCGDFNAKFRADGPYKGCYTKAVEDAVQEILELGFVDLYRQANPDPNVQPGRTRGYSDKHPDGTSRLHLALATGSLARHLRYASVDMHSKPWPRKDAPPLVVQVGPAVS